MRYWSLIILLAMCLSACSSTAKNVQEPVSEAFSRFKQGEEAYEKKNYTRAIEHWQAVRDMYYTKELTTLSERKIADAQYAAGKTIEAIAGYENFLKQHPGHPQTREVLILLGKAHYSEILIEDRDQTATRNALATFEQIQRNYPDEKDSAELEALIRQCKDRLADNELYIAAFYLKTKLYTPALERLKYLHQNYPSYTDMPKAEFLLAKAHYFTDDQEQCATLLDELEGKTLDEELRKDVLKFRKKCSI
ncbi:MAG: outer membrane protein assembly factor BamD [Desulfuromonadaceae bacterium]|nr:outer membrane protein assembly factor BamD [Desulfuromonadaceae bacterium]